MGNVTRNGDGVLGHRGSVEGAWQMFANSGATNSTHTTQCDAMRTVKLFGHFFSSFTSHFDGVCPAASSSSSSIRFGLVLRFPHCEYFIVRKMIFYFQFSGLISAGVRERSVVRTR